MPRSGIFSIVWKEVSILMIHCARMTDLPADPVEGLDGIRLPSTLPCDLLERNITRPVWKGIQSNCLLSSFESWENK